MTVPEMLTNLRTLNIPVAYRVFKNPVEPPFIVFYQNGTDNEFADNSVYKVVNSWSVELYTDTKNPPLEASLEAILPPWNKEETYISDEQLHMIVYDFEEV